MVNFNPNETVNINDISAKNTVSSSSELTTKEPDTITVEIGQKTKLKPEERNEMLLLGMDPDNEADVNSYRLLTPEDKAEKLKITKKTVKTNEEQKKTKINFDEILSKKYNIDTSSETWKSKTNIQKLNFVIETGTKAQFSEEEWSKMSESQKRQAMFDFADNSLSEYIPNWANMSETQKLEKLGGIITLYAIAKDNNMNLDDIINLKNNSPEEFASIEKSYYENGHTKVDLVKDVKEKQDQMTEFYNNHTKEFSEYCGVNNTSNIDQAEYAGKEYEFLKAKKESGELNSYQRKKLNTYETLEKNLGAENVKKLQPGNRRLIDLLSKDEIQKLNLTQDDEGKINYFDHKNIAKIKDAVMKKVLSCKSSDEIKAKLQGLGAEYMVEIIDGIGSSEELSDEFVSAFKELVGSDVSMALFDSNGIIRNPKNRNVKLQACDVKNKIRDLQNLGINDTNLEQKIQHSMTANYTKENAAQAQVTVAEMERKDLLETGNKAIAEREDSIDVFKYTNGLFADSETISDDMKEFYAQTSIEYLPPELRDQQAESLSSYNIDSFNNGIETGYANATANDLNGYANEINSTDNGIFYNNEYYAMQYVQNQQDYNYSKNLTDSEILTILSEMKTDQQKEDFVRENNISSKICNEEPSLVSYFVNIGEGMSVIKNCNVSVGDDAIKLMKKIPKEMKKLIVLVPHGRLSKVTQQDLEDRGILSPKNPNANMKSYKG